MLTVDGLMVRAVAKHLASARGQHVAAVAGHRCDTWNEVGNLMVLELGNIENLNRLRWCKIEPLKPVDFVDSIYTRPVCSNSSSVSAELQFSVSKPSTVSSLPSPPSHFPTLPFFLSSITDAMAQVVNFFRSFAHHCPAPMVSHALCTLCPHSLLPILCTAQHFSVS